MLSANGQASRSQFSDGLLEVDFVTRALDGPLHLVSLRRRYLLCHEHPGPRRENTHRVEFLLCRYEPVPIRSVVGLPVGTREKRRIWRIDLAANRIRLVDKPTNSADAFRISAVSIASHDASEP